MRRRRIRAEGGIEHEPFMTDGPFDPDPSERRAAGVAGQSADDAAAGSVWDEPALAGSVPPAGAATYAGWLRAGLAAMTPFRSAGIVGALALTSGVWAVIGTFASVWIHGAGFGWLAVLVVGPLVEELMKASAPMIAIERKPFVVLRGGWIVACCALSGAVFAAIENVLYLRVYLPDPTGEMAAWRWSICMAMHVGCAVIGGLGVRRMWSDALRHERRPDPQAAAPYLIVATVIHGLYNALAVAAGMAGLFRPPPA